MSAEKILIVEDEPELAEILQDYLQAEGFTTCIASDGEDGLKKYLSFSPHLVILDIMMPKLDGMEVCRILRAQSSVPILFLSSKGGDIDKILGLGLGADDYITKPFSPGEVVARVKAQLRRFMRLSASTSQSLSFGDLQIDISSHSVRLNNSRIELTAKEFELLVYLARHPHQVFSREQLFNQIWGYDDFGDINTVTVHIRRLREKIEADPSQPKLIQTVWGVGYRFSGEGA